MKKGLKIGLISGASVLVVGGGWAGLTKTGVIPNWFDIELLCPEDDTTNLNQSYDREDPQCSEKCYKECEKHEDEPFGYLCGNDCISKCNMPIRENCLKDCELLNIGDEEYDDCKKSCGTDPGMFMVRKPIIYLYPKQETQVNVTLGTPEILSHTYPKYNFEKGRNVVAQPNGDLEDMETGRKLYALYREGKTDKETNFDEGFVVAGKDIIPFLEEKLTILGLNEREAEEFIVYRLPQMEGNEWNLIRFETTEEQNENMPLKITPVPDTVIRVMMDWKAINEPIVIPKQKLTTPKRTGFTVVEWGGSPKN